MKKRFLFTALAIICLQFVFAETVYYNISEQEINVYQEDAQSLEMTKFATVKLQTMDLQINKEVADLKVELIGISKNRVALKTSHGNCERVYVFIDKYRTEHEVSNLYVIKTNKALKSTKDHYKNKVPNKDERKAFEAKIKPRERLKSYLV